MSWFDAAAVVVVALAILDGVMSGLAWAVVELALLVGAALAARALGGPAQPYVLKFADLSPEEAPWAAHAAVFALSACMLLGLAVLVHPLWKRWRFRRDRWLGALLGVGTGVVASLVLFAIALWATPRPYEESLRASRLVQALAAAADSPLRGLFPTGLPARLEELREP